MGRFGKWGKRKRPKFRSELERAAEQQQNYRLWILRFDLNSNKKPGSSHTDSYE